MAVVLVASAKLMEALATYLAEDSHRVIEARDSGEVLQQTMRRNPDVVVIPDDAEPVEGVDLLPVVRGLTGAAIIVVGIGDPSRMAKALFEGADAYLGLPINPAELRGRVRALLRRRGQRRRTNGGRHFLTLQQEQQIDNYLEGLSPTERRLFRLLFERMGFMVRADQLMAGVWGEEGRETVLRFYIRRIRAKLKPLGLLRVFNRKGIGYRLELLEPASAGGDA